jgi:hypothetical protein
MLTPEQKLRWVEEQTVFLRMAKIGSEKPARNFKAELNF